MFPHHLLIPPRQGFRHWLTVDSEDTRFFTTAHTAEIPKAIKLGSWTVFGFPRTCHDIGEEKPCPWLINITNTTRGDAIQGFWDIPSLPISKAASASLLPRLLCHGIPGRVASLSNSLEFIANTTHGSQLCIFLLLFPSCFACESFYVFYTNLILYFSQESAPCGAPRNLYMLVKLTDFVSHFIHSPTHHFLICVLQEL